MAYQRNLGVITQADVSSRVSLTWPDISSQVLTRFKGTFGDAPPYKQAYLKSTLWSRSGPGTAYSKVTAYNQGYVLVVTTQYGNWFLLSTGDYIPISQTADYKQMVADRLAADVKEKKRLADIATDEQIKKAIAYAAPFAIKEAVDEYNFTAVGISTAVIADLLKRVKDKIITMTLTALGVGTT